MKEARGSKVTLLSFSIRTRPFWCDFVDRSDCLARQALNHQPILGLKISNVAQYLFVFAIEFDFLSGRGQGKVR